MIILISTYIIDIVGAQMKRLQHDQSISCINFWSMYTTYRILCEIFGKSVCNFKNIIFYMNTYYIWKIHTLICDYVWNIDYILCTYVIQKQRFRINFKLLILTRFENVTHDAATTTITYSFFYYFKDFFYYIGSYRCFQTILLPLFILFRFYYFFSTIFYSDTRIFHKLATNKKIKTFYTYHDYFKASTQIFILLFLKFFNSYDM